MPLRFLTSIAIALASWSAAAMDLVAWKAVDGLPPFIIAARATETPDQAARRYVQLAMHTPGITELLAHRLAELRFGEYSRVNTSNGALPVLLLANSDSDYQVIPNRKVKAFSDQFAANSGATYILPIAHDLGLSGSEIDELHERLSLQFPLVVAMGGADLDTDTYNEPNTDSVNMNAIRDRSELRFLRSYLGHERGLLVGVCRGAQAISVAPGYKLTQEVTKEYGSTVDHKDGAKHAVAILPVANSWLAQLTAGAREMLIASWHHQAINLRSRPDGPLVLTAQSFDGVPEAMQSRDGRILLFQFHPELMTRLNGLATEGSAILKGWIETARSQRARRCSGLFVRLVDPVRKGS